MNKLKDIISWVVALFKSRFTPEQKRFMKFGKNNRQIIILSATAGMGKARPI